MTTPQKQPRYGLPFWLAYFFYYAGYCVFSSYIVLYLTEQGYSATLCGIITSLTLLANLLMESVGGYITDTFLPTRRYLTLCIGAILLLCLFCTRFSDRAALCLPALVLTAGLAYPFSQLMDAWVSCSQQQDPSLVYSTIRAGGSIGFGAASVLAGYYFRQFGWGSYFLVQAVLFLLMLPFVAKLPLTELGNRQKTRQAGHSLSLAGSFRVVIRNRPYMLCLLVCTMYWFSHRPVGSYLALLVEARGGDTSTFGNVCGAGAVVEFLALMLLAVLQRSRPLSRSLCLIGALFFDVLRPLCLQFLPGLWPLYAGQVMQSVSFALFYSASVSCFTAVADRRIPSFCISMGLTVSSVGGTIAANLLGGWMRDALEVGVLVPLSLALSLTNCLLLALCFRCIFTPAGAPAADPQ